MAVFGRQQQRPGNRESPGHRRAALSYALVGSRRCSSCCTTVVRDSSRAASPRSSALAGASRADAVLTAPVRLRRRGRGGSAPDGPRRRTRQRVRGVRRALRGTAAMSTRARRRSARAWRSPQRHVEPAGELGLADRLAVTKLVQPNLLQGLGPQTGEPLRSTRLRDRSVAKLGELGSCHQISGGLLRGRGDGGLAMRSRERRRPRAARRRTRRCRRTSRVRRRRSISTPDR